MERDKFKKFYLLDKNLPYLTKADYASIAEESAEFKDALIEYYFNSIDNIEELKRFFHPTNESTYIFETMPGFPKKKLEHFRPRTTSPNSFSETYHYILNCIEEYAPEYYLQGALYLEKKDAYDLIKMIRWSSSALKEFDYTPHLVNLLNVFDHLSEQKLKKIYDGLYTRQKEFDEITL
jgi:hypothetical protein